MAKALYRKYRSRKLSEIVGQEHVTTLLENALKTGRIAHAYLFTGPRGVGKTSIARILAHEINQLPYDEDSRHLDIIEIDAASNNGVDDIRDLREKVALAPTSAQKKVYIIDEVHMLSKPAFNALLKTLEEPPDHVIFILATTDIDKLPETIISRTQRYTFRHASEADIIKNLTRIIEAESLHIDNDALQLIAAHSDGSYRDSVSLLDQLSSLYADERIVTAAAVEQTLGLAPIAAINHLLQALTTHDFAATIQQLKRLRTGGFEASVVALQLIQAIEHDPAMHAALLPLIEKLIQIRTSGFSDSLLLSILGSFSHNPDIHTKPISRPTATSRTVSSVELPALAKKATQPHPKDDLVVDDLALDAPVIDDAPMPHSDSEQLDWSTVFGDLSALSIGLRSVLSKCSFANDAVQITVYTRNEFYKKKLDTSKYRRELTDFLRTTTQREWTLEFVPGLKPSKNQAVVSVAAIMGGGEEVSIDSL